jgi:hypothetical protein
VLTSALEQYEQQQRLTALAVRQARRVEARGDAEVVRVLSTYQLAAVALTTGSTAAILDEQGIDAPPEGQVGAAALLTGRGASGLINSTRSAAAFDRLIASLVQDVGRTAAAVDITSRPALSGYVRSLNPPSCGRCAILAGRVYRYSTGFQRHPGCDCLMTPTTLAAGQDLVTDPTDLLANGQIRGLSKGDLAALDHGADLGQVVNVRKKQAGLTVGSSVLERAGRLTPQGILRLASTRAEQIALLKRWGYLL